MATAHPFVDYHTLAYPLQELVTPVMTEVVVAMTVLEVAYSIAEVLLIGDHFEITHTSS